MKGSLRTRNPVVALIVATLAGCDLKTPSDLQTGTGPDGMTFGEGVSAAIMDASRTGGTEGFNWMPPFSPRRRSYPAAFDGSLDPTVEVCEWVQDTCAATVATMTVLGTQFGKVTVNRRLEVYETTWRPSRRKLDPRRTYRVRVSLQGRILGYVDLDLVGTFWGLLGVDLRNFFPLIPGIDLPIRFRLAQGLGCVSPSLRVSLGDGVGGSPAQGELAAACGETVAYSFEPADGFENLLVSFNGVQVPKSGSIQISGAARLVAVAAKQRTTLPAGTEPVVAALRAALRSAVPNGSVRIMNSTTKSKGPQIAAAIANPDQVARFQNLVDEMAKWAEAHPQSAGRDLQAIYDAETATEESRSQLELLNSVTSGLTYNVDFSRAQQPAEPGAAQPLAQTKVLFVNGIWTSAVQAAIQATLLGLAVREAGLPGTTTGGVYNKSFTDPSTDEGRAFGCALAKAPNAAMIEAVELLAPQTSIWCRDALGRAADFAEAGYQVFRQSVKIAPATTDGQQLAAALKLELESGKRVIAVAHSQGNLMTSEAIATGAIPQALLGNLSVISLAAPKPGRPFPGAVGVYDCWNVRGDIIDLADFLITLPDRVFLLGQSTYQSAACATTRVTNALTAQVDEYYARIAEQVQECEVFLAVGAAGCPDLKVTPVVSSVGLHSFDASYLEAYASPRYPSGQARSQLLQILRAHQNRLQGANLTVTINGLPQGTNASVTVTGPWTFSRPVTASAVFGGVSYGTYSFQAAEVVGGNVRCTPGAVTGSAELSSPAGSTISVNYACVSVQPPVVLTATPTAISFTSVQSGLVPAAQAVTISAQGGSLTGLSATTVYQSGQGWLSVSLSGTTTPATVSLVPALSLPQGIYDASVTVTANGGARTNVAVRYQVSAAPATIACNGTPQLGCGLGADQFAVIPRGTFQMVDPLVATVGPIRTVTVSSFLMQRTEVTQAQWRAVMTGTALANPSYFSTCGDTCPVEQVSWNDITTFLTRLNAATPGVTYRLPTEAEWEYAARAGTTADAYGILDAIAWYSGTTGGVNSFLNSGVGTRPVTGKAPNAFGLYDMLGNIDEWVNDAYGPYAPGAVTDPTGPVATASSNRVLRGGSWGSTDVRAGLRGSYSPSPRIYFFGFRLVRTP